MVTYEKLHSSDVYKSDDQSFHLHLKMCLLLFHLRDDKSVRHLLLLSQLIPEIYEYRRKPLL